MSASFQAVQTLPTWLVIAFLTGLGCYLLYLERKLINRGFLSYKWPKLKAVIKDQRDDSFEITGYTNPIGGSRTIRFKEIAYIYEYKVGNRNYLSSNYCFGGWGDRQHATYTVGQHIRISYNPDDPSESVIKCGVMPGALIGLLPIALAITGVIMTTLLYAP